MLHLLLRLCIFTCYYPGRVLLSDNLQSCSFISCTFLIPSVPVIHFRTFGVEIWRVNPVFAAKLTVDHTAFQSAAALQCAGVLAAAAVISCCTVVMQTVTSRRRFNISVIKLCWWRTWKLLLPEWSICICIDWLIGLYMTDDYNLLL